MKDEISVFRKRYIFLFIFLLASIFTPYRFDIRRGWIRSFSRWNYYGILDPYYFIYPRGIGVLLILTIISAFILILLSVINVYNENILAAKKKGRLGLILYAFLFIHIIIVVVRYNTYFNVGFFVGIASWIGLCYLHFDFYRANQELYQELTLEKKQKKREEIQNTVFCTKCGYKNKADSNSCNTCGISFSQYPPKKTPKRSNWPGPIFCIGIITIIAMFVLRYSLATALFIFIGLIMVFIGLTFYIWEKIEYNKYAQVIREAD